MSKFSVFSAMAGWIAFSNMQLLAKIATKFNLAASNFKKFPGGHAPRPPKNQHALHAMFILFSILKNVHFFLKKDHPT